MVDVIINGNALEMHIRNSEMIFSSHFPLSFVEMNVLYAQHQNDLRLIYKKTTTTTGFGF